MSYIKFNPNPLGKTVGDCVIRAISAFLGTSWEWVYSNLAAIGFEMCDMPSSNAVWGAFLDRCGCQCYRRNANYLVDFGANIAIPTGGTVGDISVAISLDGSVISPSTMIVTPAAVEEFFNVSRAVNVQIWSGCCETLTIQNTSDQPILIRAISAFLVKPSKDGG